MFISFDTRDLGCFDGLVGKLVFGVLIVVDLGWQIDVLRCFGFVRHVMLRERILDNFVFYYALKIGGLWLLCGCVASAALLWGFLVICVGVGRGGSVFASGGFCFVCECCIICIYLGFV